MHKRDRERERVAAVAARRAIGPVLVLVVTLLSSFAVAQSDVFRFRVAVLDFGVIDLSGTLADPDAHGRAIAAEFDEPLLQARRFVVLERRDLVRVFDEQSLTEEGLTAEVVRQFGELFAADAIITGTITVNPSGTIRVLAKIVDVKSGEVVVAHGLTADRLESRDQIARDFVELALAQFPLRGHVVAIEADQVYINLGVSQGLSTGAATGAIYRERRVADLDVSERIGTFRVNDVRPEASIIEPTMRDGQELRVGDVVEILPIGIDDTARPPEPEPEAPASGSLLVRGAPVGATVYVDGEDVGVTGESGLLRSLPVGSVWVEVRSDGYEPFARRVEVSANRIATLVAELVLDEPSEGALYFAGLPRNADVYVEGRYVGSGRSVLVEGLAPGSYSYRVEADGYESVTGLVQVVAGAHERVTDVTVELVPPDPIEGELRFVVLPADARVYVDGALVGTGYTLIEGLAPGLYRYRVEADGHESIAGEVQVRVGERQQIRAFLTREEPATVPVGPLRLEGIVGTFATPSVGWAIAVVVAGDAQHASTEEEQLVRIRGPEDWSERQPFEIWTTVGSAHRPVSWYFVGGDRSNFRPGAFSGPPPVPGEYTFEMTVGGYRASHTFQLSRSDAALSLPLPTNITYRFPSREQVRIWFDEVAGAEEYLVCVYRLAQRRGCAWTRHGQVDINLQRLSSEVHIIDVWAFNRDMGNINFETLDGPLAISRTSVTVYARELPRE